MTLHTGPGYQHGVIRISTPDVNLIRTVPVAYDVEIPVKHWLQAGVEREDVYYFSVYHEERLIGQILLHDMDDKESLVAYHLFQPDYRGKGFGTTMLKLLQAYVRENTELETLIVITSRDNLASQRIAQRCGFTFIGSSREDPKNGLVYRWDVNHV